MKTTHDLGSAQATRIPVKRLVGWNVSLYGAPVVSDRYASIKDIFSLNASFTEAGRSLPGRGGRALGTRRVRWARRRRPW